MRTTLVLVALPTGNVVVGETRVFVGTVVDGSMKARLKPYAVERLVGETGLYPKSRKGVTRGLLAVELIILEECKCIGINGEDTRIIGREPMVEGHQFRSQILSLDAQERG